MYRIIIGLGLLAVGAVPAAAQSPHSKPLPKATVARIRVETQRARHDAEQQRLLLRRSPSARGSAQATSTRPAKVPLTLRPPKKRPMD